jgi:hypothetical protein
MSGVQLENCEIHLKVEKQNKKAANKKIPRDKTINRT